MSSYNIKAGRGLYNNLSHAMSVVPVVRRQVAQFD